jgi:hypothetical protein
MGFGLLEDTAHAQIATTATVCLIIEQIIAHADG